MIDDDAYVVVALERLERFAERDHHVERHRVHALGTIECDQRDMRPGLAYEKERKTRRR